MPQLSPFLFPYLTWLAPLTSMVVLLLWWNLGELEPRKLALLAGWFGLAAYWQFVAGSAVLGAAGLFLQTALAIYLLVRWKLSW